MRSACISCMQNEASASNGGLCSSCAPPLRIVLHGHRTYTRNLTERNTA